MIGRRSCLRRLAGHNKRRRKTLPDATVVNGGSLNEEKGSSYLLMSLLRILSNMHCEFVCVQKFIYLAFVMTLIYLFGCLLAYSFVGISFVWDKIWLSWLLFLEKGGSFCMDDNLLTGVNWYLRNCDLCFNAETLVL